MKRFYYLAVCSILSLSISNRLSAQSLQERLEKFGEDFSKGYTAPFVDAFGASLNSGWYSTANVEDGLDIFVGVKAMLMPIPDDGKTFNIASPYDGVIQQVPTAFGSKDEIAISNAPANVEPNKYPGGFDFSLAPMLVPHLSVGNIFGTRVMLRWLPPVKLGDMGDFSFFGLGVQHSLNRYIPVLPLDVSAMVAYQNLSLGDILTTKAFTFGAQASKTFAILTVYGGVAYESSTMSFTYTATYTDPNNTSVTVTKPVAFDISGTNSARATVGIALSLAIIKINADYSFASQPVASVGFGIGW
jgi:hypothetical protein